MTLKLSREQDHRHSPNVNAEDGHSSSFYASDTSKIDWYQVSNWCQSCLGLPDSSLDSLWYERLSEAALSQDSGADIALGLYKHALHMESPSWLCHRGLGKTYFLQNRTSEAIEELQLALKEAQQEGATPDPNENDITDLHLLLGEYMYVDGQANAQEAADHYEFACMSEDPDEARRGQLGRLTAKLRFPDEEVRSFLRDKLAQDGGEDGMISVLQMIALDADHGAIFSKIFTVAMGHQDLFGGIVRALETAITRHDPSKDLTDDLDENERFAADETRGVLLYYRGVAAYTYEVTSEGTESIKKALRLWEECREQLSDIGGSNAFVVKKAATTDLAKHYFQSMRDKPELDYIDKLTKLTDDSSSSDDPSGLLGALYALRGKKQRSREVLLSRVTYALQILADDTPDNDHLGFSLLYKTLAQYHDFRNAIIAISMMGQPDLVTEALLYFKKEDIVGDNVLDKRLVLDVVTKLGKETIQLAKAQVPSSSQQIQRIEVASMHIGSLLAANEAKYEGGTEAGDDGEAKKSEGRSNGESNHPGSTTAAAQRFFQSRLSALQQTHTPNIDTDALVFGWTCDGRTPDGKKCENQTDFERSLYHCIYCSNRDFCGDCLRRLRDPKSCAEITACSTQHRWLRIPPQGGDMYGGFRAESVRVPCEVKPLEGDEDILEAHHAADEGGQETTVEEWKRALADEWGIALERYTDRL